MIIVMINFDFENNNYLYSNSNQSRCLFSAPEAPTKVRKWRGPREKIITHATSFGKKLNGFAKNFRITYSAKTVSQNILFSYSYSSRKGIT